VDEYRHTSYDPDCDYVDGEIVERNVGERDHSELQGEIYAFIRSLRRKLNVHPYIEQRVQVSPTRFLIPDICVMQGDRPTEQIFTYPPLIAIEILSKDDRMGQMQERIDDYLKFGVRYVWIINPGTQRAWVYTKEGGHEAKDGILRTENPEIELPLPEIFQALQ
jgi:Uma2 family endonuclease